MSDAMIQQSSTGWLIASASRANAVVLRVDYGAVLDPVAEVEEVMALPLSLTSE